MTPREPKVSDWRGGRAGPVTSRHSAARASGMAGDWGDDLAGVQRTKRSGVNGTPVSSSSGPRSRTREGNKARDPRARERAAVVDSAGPAGMTWLFGIAMKAQPCSLLPASPRDRYINGRDDGPLTAAPRERNRSAPCGLNTPEVIQVRSTGARSTAAAAAVPTNCQGTVIGRSQRRNCRDDLIIHTGYLWT